MFTIVCYGSGCELTELRIRLARSRLSASDVELKFSIANMIHLIPTNTSTSGLPGSTQ